MFTTRRHSTSIPKRLAQLVAVVATMIGFAGCVTPPSSDERPVVVVGMYPLEFVVEEVAGSLVDVHVLVPPGVEPHDYELTPSQMALVQSADLVFYQSGISPAIDAALSDRDMSQVVDTATLVGGLPIDHDHDHGHDHDHEIDRDIDGNPLPGTPMDPHTWLSPINMTAFANVFADRAVGLLPAHETTIRDANRGLVSRLGDLDTAYLTGLASCERREFLAAHAAFGYLANAYNLTQLSISGINPEDEPTPAHLAQVTQLAQEYGITTVFYEPLVSQDAVNMFASDLGLHVAMLDPVEAITEASPGQDYLEVMYANLEALQLANGCTA